MPVATVTGASGHLGANLVRLLISQGWHVKAMVHNNCRSLIELNIDRVIGDLLDPKSLSAAFQGSEVVFHLAARISVVRHDYEMVEAVNIRGVKNVVDACLIAGVKRLVHVSSFHAFQQEPLAEVLDEERPLFSDGRYPPYDYSKAEGEKIVLQGVKNGLDAVILAPTGIIGPYDYEPSHFGAALLMIAGGKLPALIKAGLNWVDVRDVAYGLLKACELANSGEKYLLGGHWISLGDIASHIAKITGRRPPGINLPLWLAKAVAPVAGIYDRLGKRRQLFTSISMLELGSNPNISHAKAARELGYAPRSIDETITDTMEWFRSNGMISY